MQSGAANFAAVAVAGGFLGSTSLLAEMPEAQLYLKAVRFSEELMSDHPSIVNTSIASAIELYATQTIWDVQTEIQKFRSGLELRKRIPIPH